MTSALPNPELPKLAWFAAIDRESNAIRVEHGRSVEIRDRFFVEGVWDAP